jgi:uncharacterized membrane protein
MGPARSFANTLALLALLFCGATLSPEPAHAAKQGWVVCNATSYVLEAAVARPQDKRRITEGWIRLRPGECRQAVAAPLARGEYLLFAQSSSAHRGGRQNWTGDTPLCVDSRPSFSYENPKDCNAMGLEERKARRVTVTARENWTTWLMEADIGTLAAARASGVTRLLEDAGYEARRPDGTLKARAGPEMLARFIADARLPARASHAQVVDQLEALAKKRRQETGLKLCNRGKSKAWTAIAQRKPDGWETRGWWSLAPGGCAKVINDTLYQPIYYVHAVLESPTGDRQVAAASAPFCVARAQFVVIGQEACESRYYETKMFFSVSPQGRAGLVVDLPESAFGPPPARRAAPRPPEVAAAPGALLPGPAAAVAAPVDGDKTTPKANAGAAAGGK